MQFRIVARLRPLTRGEQASRAQPCVRALHARTVVLAASETEEAQTLTCHRVIAPSEVYPSLCDPALADSFCIVWLLEVIIGAPRSQGKDFHFMA